MFVQYYGVSDIGRKRKENQDRIYLPDNTSELKLFILADGMGGANAGSVASSTAIDFIKKYITKRWTSISLEREEIESLSMMLYQRLITLFIASQKVQTNMQEWERPLLLQLLLEIKFTLDTLVIVDFIE